MNTIFIRDLEIMMSIGIHDHERVASQRVLVSIDAELDPNMRHNVDHIDETVSYETLVNTVKSLAQTRHFDLVETLAEEVAAECLKDQRIHAIGVEIAKPDIFSEVVEVGVAIERHR